MTTVVLYSHDGFGLGHVRRNTLIARAIVTLDPTARVVLVTGVAARPRWLTDARFCVVRVLAIVKDEEGVYPRRRGALRGTLDRRADVFERVVDRAPPDVVLVDRHPDGAGGELVPGLQAARALENGASSRRARTRPVMRCAGHAVFSRGARAGR